MPNAGSARGRAEIRSKPQRGVPDEAAEILRAGVVAHVGFAVDGQPYVIPMTYHFDAARPDEIHLHGTQHGRLMQHLADGAPACVTVTLVDGLVYSRTAKYHSVNYRSVVAFGRAGPQPAAEERRALLDGMVARIFPGRTAGRDYEPMPDAHLEATAFVTLRVEEWSAKARRGGPLGPQDAEPDDASPYTRGVVPLREA
ncbi:MAG: flavin-nucleotide-binding protein [Gemmatimonadetes bacterium]|nr:flavin-nucleotide-binding protein [Gemmatimonadota bacterium]